MNLLNIEQKQISKEHFILGKKLVYDLMDKKITLREFEIEVAYLAWNCGFDELRFKPEPSPPHKLTEYRAMRWKDRLEIKKEFWEDREIKEYLKETEQVEAYNCSTCWWLTILENRFRKIKDFKRANACKERLEKFPERLKERYSLYERENKENR